MESEKPLGRKPLLKNNRNMVEVSRIKHASESQGIATGNQDLEKTLLSYYAALLRQFGHRNWWPGETPFEVCVGAILTQNTAWKNVVLAIDNLKAASLLDAWRLHETPHDQLAELIRSAGYFNLKARRLRNFVDHLVQRHEGALLSLFSAPVDELRTELLTINGVGKETADSIILYAAGKPIFVVDAYTRRVFVRHGLISSDDDYDTIQDLFHRNLPTDTALFNDFHAQIVAAGHYYCKRTPACETCPLGSFL